MTNGTINKRKDGWHTWIEGITKQEFTMNGGWIISILMKYLIL